MSFEDARPNSSANLDNLSPTVGPTESLSDNGILLF